MYLPYIYALTHSPSNTHTHTHTHQSQIALALRPKSRLAILFQNVECESKLRKHQHPRLLREHCMKVHPSQPWCMMNCNAATRWNT